ncbi:hypothetical protein [Variovorax sp. OV329]|uniref:hypothetical protein n=1 Tax=Variovorax sp. OV329 TaxID=1882825 RepID=UPI0008E76383|nr:hypothetical protein [Variovorax sp. OV329]SFM64020.1 hypothetical protein SAMN05444747_107105 [Variovorax sp. OV329]
MATKRAVFLFAALGLLSLAGAVLSLVTNRLEVEQKYLGVTLGLFLALLSVARVQELRRAVQRTPVRRQTFSSTRKPQLTRRIASLDDREEEELAARLAQLRARARPASPVQQPDFDVAEEGPASSFAGLDPVPSRLDQRGDELRADIARLREGSRARRTHPEPAASASVSVAPPGFLDELSVARSRTAAPAPLTPQPLPSTPKPAPAREVQDDHGLEDLFPRTQLSGLEVTHVQTLEEQGDPFEKTQFTDFGHADHEQFASTEYLGPAGPRK